MARFHVPTPSDKTQVALASFRVGTEGDVWDEGPIAAPAANAKIPVKMDAKVWKETSGCSRLRRRTGSGRSRGYKPSVPSAPMFMRCDPARLAYVDRRWEWAFTSFDSCYLWSMQDERRELLDGARRTVCAFPGQVPVGRCFTIAACDGRTWPLVRMELKFAIEEARIRGHIRGIPDSRRRRSVLRTGAPGRTRVRTGCERPPASAGSRCCAS